MASAFIGLSVKVLLTNGTSLKGHVADVDQITQRLMLQDVVIQYAEEKVVRVMSTFSVAGGEIKDLQVLPTQPAVHPPPHAPVSPSLSSTSISTASTAKQQHYQPQPPHQTHLQNEHIHAPLVAPSPRQLPAHPHPSSVSASVVTGASSPSSLPYHDPAIISFKPSSSPLQKQAAEEVEALAEKMSTARINKQGPQHQNQDNLTMAESSATESAPRGPRRARHNKSNSNNRNSNLNYNSNNNMSDYGSPRATHKTVSGKRSSRRYKEPVHEWAQGDTDDFKDEDFDFQHNLGLFDKARVFAEIREADDTAPESLLVNLNRNPERARAMEESPMLRKLLPTEMVLDPAPKRSMTYKRNSSKNHVHGSGLSEEDEVDDYEDDDSWNSSSVDDEPCTIIKPMSGVASSAVASSAVASSAKSKTGMNKGSGSPSSATPPTRTNGDGGSNNVGGSGKKRGVKIQTLSGVACPTVTSAQMQEVERLSASEIGLSEGQMIENGGRGAAMMCLQALGGSRRIQPNNHNAAPVVVLLAGNNRTGAYTLCAGRHLSNHGCLVLAFVAGSNNDGQMHPAIASQSRGFLAAGGELIHTIPELPQSSSSPVDLIMDGMLGYQYTVREIVDAYERETICDLMDWANDNKAPVLSLDMPSGVDGTTGHGDKTKFCVRPKWTLCLGAPKTGCRSRSTTGELFLTDLGIPRVCWKKAGVKGWGMPWGADFLVGLEYL
ncbi:enhancer of mRNA decapping [Haplosporangium sp. Z 11]|nr:enhancer of mRNA decapping [Haplosporangium sp. Z 11]